MHKTEFLYDIQKIKKSYVNQFKALRTTHSLSQNELDILLFLANNPGHDTASDIVEIRSLSKSQVSKSIENLIWKSYINTEEDKHDRRCIHLTLEPAVHNIISEAQEIQQKYVKKLFSGISAEEADFMKKMFSQIRNNAEGMTEDDS